MREDVLSIITAHAPPDAPLIVAVSGGLDSLCLLHLLAHQSGLRLHVATFDHGLRADSAADARVVAEQAVAWGLPCTVGHADLDDRSEATARRARYDFLADVARRIGATIVITAHHADDQAETVLLNLLRGTGLRGLGGMKTLAPMPGHPDLSLLRPLLSIRRDDLRRHASAHGLTPREDPTNADTTYRRNRIRHEMMPLLEAINPDVVAALTRLAESAALDEAFLDAQASSALADLARVEGGCVLLDRDGFNALHPAVARRVMRQALPATVEAGHDHLLHALQVAREGNVGAVAEFPDGVVLRVGYGTLFVGEPGTCEAVERSAYLQMPADAVIPVHLPGTSPVPGAGWHIVATEGCAGSPHARLAIPPDAEVVLRTRRPGDRFAPLGLGGTQSLKEWLIDHKIPRSVRAGLPLLVVNGTIAAILVDDTWSIAEIYAVQAHSVSNFCFFVDFS